MQQDIDRLNQDLIDLVKFVQRKIHIKTGKKPGFIIRYFITKFILEIAGFHLNIIVELPLKNDEMYVVYIDTKYNINDDFTRRTLVIDSKKELYNVIDNIIDAIPIPRKMY